MKTNLLKLLQNQILLSDGGIGTELQRMGLEPGSNSEIWNVQQPKKIQALHRLYLDAGARLLTTNSFRGNRFALKSYGLEDQVVELNRLASELAREVAGETAWVMGSMGPIGELLHPLGEAMPQDVFDSFVEQARALLAGGADVILIETMSDLQEVELAIAAAREALAPVVISTMTFGHAKEDYRTMMGVSPRQAAEAMERAGADVVGCNCGTDLEMEDYMIIVREMRAATSLPILAQPNAGRPELVGEEIVYRRSPEEMASKMIDLVHAGANIVGGCCGTTPDHIRAFAEKLQAQPHS